MARLSKSDTLMATAELRAGSVITEQEINCLKRRWAPHRPKVENPYVEAEAFFKHGPYWISDEQAEKGINYWRAKCFMKNGNRRDNQFTRANMNDFNWRVLENFYRFQLVAFEFEANAYVQFPYPIYRMIATDGGVFDYLGKRVWGEDQQLLV